MPAPKMPTMDEIQQATYEAQDRARMAGPRRWPLFPAAPYDAEIDGPLHTVQERMTSGGLGDAPDDGGPLALGKGDNSLPFRTTKE